MNNFVIPHLQEMLRLDPSGSRRTSLRMQFPEEMAAIEKAEQPAVTVQSIEQAIGRQFQMAIPALTAFADAFRSSLPPEELEAFGKYLAGGAPGFMQAIQSDSFKPVLQLAWDIIKGGGSATTTGTTASAGAADAAQSADDAG